MILVRRRRFQEGEGYLGTWCAPSRVSRSTRGGVLEWRDHESDVGDGVVSMSDGFFEIKRDKPKTRAHSIGFWLAFCANRDCLELCRAEYHVWTLRQAVAGEKAKVG